MKDILSYLTSDTPALLIMCGYPCAGKSHLVDTILKQTEDVVVVSVDALLTDMGFVQKAEKSPDCDEWLSIYEQSYVLTEAALKSGMHVIYNHTNHTVACRAVLHKLAVAAGATALVAYVDASIQEVWGYWERNPPNTSRPIMSRNLFESTIANFEPPTKEEDMMVIKVRRSDM